MCGASLATLLHRFHLPTLHSIDFPVVSLLFTLGDGQKPPGLLMPVSRIQHSGFRLPVSNTTTTTDTGYQRLPVHAGLC